MKKVYIIVPVYNVEKYISKCLDSLLSQTYKDIDIICVNDGSTDKSADILNRYLKQHKRLTVLTKTNGGLSSARNFALNNIKMIEESYIAFVDSDDYVANDYIETLVHLSNRYDSNCVIASYYNIHEGNEENDFLGPVDVKEKIMSSKDALLEMLRGRIKCHAHCKLFKSSLWHDARFDENVSFMEDQYLIPTIVNRANSVVVSTYSGYYYLHRLGSLCQSKMTFKKIDDALSSYIYLYNYDFGTSVRNDLKIKKLCLNQLVEIYFMMYPRVMAIELSNNELKKFNDINDFIKEHHAVMKYKPKNIKTFMKKMVYIANKSIYLKIYQKHLKIYDN